MSRRSGRKAGDVFPVEGDAAVADRFEPGDQPQAGGLAAAGRPQQGDEGAVGNPQGETVDRNHRSEPFRDVSQGDFGHQPFTEPASRPETIMRWNRKASTRGGTMASTPAVVISV